MFGQELSSLAGAGLLPPIVAQAVAFLDDKGLTVEGIFRNPANAAVLHALRKAYDNGEDVDLSIVSDAHVVAGLLKLFFRELPEPLLTFELYDEWIAAEALDDERARLARICAIVARLPPANRAVLAHLVGLLSRVGANSAINKMTDHHLAIVWAPNIFYPSDAMAQVEQTSQIRGLVEILITNADAIFKAGAGGAPTPAGPLSPITPPAGAKRPTLAPPSPEATADFLDRPVTPTSGSAASMTASDMARLNSLVDSAVQSLTDFSVRVHNLAFVADVDKCKADAGAQKARLRQSFGPMPAALSSIHQGKQARVAAGKGALQVARTQAEAVSRAASGADAVAAEFSAFLQSNPALKELLHHSSATGTAAAPADADAPGADMAATGATAPAMTVPPPQALQENVPTFSGSMAWMTPAEQASLKKEYFDLRASIATFETEFCKASGRLPNADDREASGVTAVYVMYTALHALLEDQSTSQIQAVYRGHIGRAHYNQVKSERSSASERSPAAAGERAPAGSRPAERAVPAAAAKGPVPKMASVEPPVVGSPTRPQPGGSRTIATTTTTPPPADAESRDAAKGPLEHALSRLQAERELHMRPSDISRMTMEEKRSEKHAIKKELKAYDAAFLARHGRECTKAEKEPMRPLYKRYKDLKDILEGRQGSVPALDTMSLSGTRPGAAQTSRSPVSASSASRTTPARPTSSPANRAAASATVPGRRNAKSAGTSRHQGTVGVISESRAASSIRQRQNAFAEKQRPEAALSVQGISPRTAGTAAGNSGTTTTDGFSEANYRELKAEKRALQTMLQNYQTEFMRKHGRRIRLRNERLAVEAEYERYKVVKVLLEEMEKKRGTGRT